MRQIRPGSDLRAPQGRTLACLRVLAVALAGGLIGCAAPGKSAVEPPPPTAAESGAPAVANGYFLQVGDQVDVRLYYHPELNDSALVRPDGKLSLPLIGDVIAAGRTPEDLGAQLVEKYEAVGLRSPSVAVVLRKSAGQRVFVGGEVGTPRMVTHEGRMTLAQAIFEAGGFKSTADRSSVVLLRDNGQGGAVVRNVNFDREVLKEGRDIPLQPYDVVVVPQSGIAMANLFVEQYLSKMVPTWLSFGFSYVTGKDVVVR
jgi:protein involved in polysaccharide export with SLBB domain